MTSLFDSERIDALFAVLGEAAGRRLLTAFADELDGETRTIADFAAQGNMPETERHAHGLMGAAANLGAAQLQAALHALELAARAHVASHTLEALVADIEQVARRTSSTARAI